MMKKTYLLSDLKPVPDFLRKKFAGFSPERLIYSRLDEDKMYRNAISGRIKLETIIVIVDILKGEHRRDKKYVRWVRTERCSLVQEKVNRYFSDHDIECRQAAEKKVKKKKIEIYHAYDLLIKQSLNRFLNEAHQRMRKPEDWEKKIKELTRDRFCYQIARIYDVPYPWNYWDYRNSAVQTYFFVEKGQTSCVSGGSGSSGQRENHSRYGFLFARCQNKGIDIPTHIMIYDDHNRFKYLTSSKSLVLSSHDLGSNYHIDWKERKRILKDIPLLHVSFGYFTKDKQFKIQIRKDVYQSKN